MGWQTTLATVFQGTNFVFNSNGEFFYDTSGPGLNNLSISITGFEPTNPNALIPDGFGNNVPQGTTNYFSGTSYAALTIVNGGIVVYEATTQAGPWSLVQSLQFEGGNIVLSPGTYIIVDGWHPITLDSGWTAGSPVPQYKFTNEGNIQLAGMATHAAMTTETALNSSNPLPARYRPVTDKKIYQGNRAGGLTGAALNTTGIVYAEPNGVSATTLDLTGMTDLL